MTVRSKKKETLLHVIPVGQFRPLMEEVLLLSCQHPHPGPHCLQKRQKHKESCLHVRDTDTAEMEERDAY